MTEELESGVIRGAGVGPAYYALWPDSSCNQMWADWLTEEAALNEWFFVWNRIPIRRCTPGGVQTSFACGMIAIGDGMGIYDAEDWIS